jgi:hypothetical protein
MHDASSFRLAGKHRSVPCRDCHPKDLSIDSRTSLGDAAILIRRRHDRCSDCHDAAHGEQLARLGDEGDCGSCHGLEAWKPSTYGFDRHDATPFPLDGAHRSAACSSCHGQERPGLPRLAARPDLGRARVGFDLETTCGSCHYDAHDGRYSAGGAERCASCHGTDRFRPANVGVEEHLTYGYPLAGDHRAVPCVECHEELKGTREGSSLILEVADRAPMLFRLKHDDCGDCHQDPHRGQFAKTCSECHADGVFHPAALFDHDDVASFTLREAHSNVPCHRCHPTVPLENGSSYVVYRPLSSRCEGCHATPVPEDQPADATGGSGGEP